MQSDRCRFTRTIVAVAVLVILPGMAAGETIGINEFARADLDPPAARDLHPELVVEAFGQRWTIGLTDNSRLLGALSPALRARAIGEGNRFMSGLIEGREGSWVRFNWINGYWQGGLFDGEELYLVDQAGSMNLPGTARVAPDTTIVYRFSDLELSGILGHEPLVSESEADRDAAQSYQAFSDHLDGAGNRDGSFEMPVTVVVDTAFADTHGQDVAAVATGRMNFVDGIYLDQLGTGIGFYHLEILEDDGPLVSTDAELLLEEFSDFMDTGAGSDIPFGGLAHLFTSRSRDGAIAGIAWFNGLCTNYAGYGVDWELSSETTNSLVLAHELGHNFGAPHDGFGACSDETFQGIMNANINGSEEFSDCSLSEMSEAVDNASCLVAIQADNAIFTDRFGGP